MVSSPLWQNPSLQPALNLFVSNLWRKVVVVVMGGVGGNAEAVGAYPDTEYMTCSTRNYKEPFCIYKEKETTKSSSGNSLCELRWCRQFGVTADADRWNQNKSSFLNWTQKVTSQIYFSFLFLHMSSNRTFHNKRQCSRLSHHRVSICYLTVCKQQSCVHVCSFSSVSSKHVLQAPLLLTAVAGRNYSRAVLSPSFRGTKCGGVMRSPTQK